MSEISYILAGVVLGIILTIASVLVVRVVLEIEDRRLAGEDVEEDVEEALWIEPQWDMEVEVKEVKEDELWETPEY